MNPIIDTYLLKHHRVDYGRQVDKTAGQRVTKPHSSILAFATWVPVFLLIFAFGSWGA
jgi:hypothetical protein